MAGVSPRAPATNAGCLGKNDPIFGPEGARAFEDDLDTVEIHLFNTGHFALEEDCEEIAKLTREFLTDHVVAD